MSAGTDDPAIGKDENPVGMHCGNDALSYHNPSSSRKFFVYRFTFASVIKSSAENESSKM